MSRKSVAEMKLDALADYLGVEFNIKADQAICVEDDDYRGTLSEADVEKIVDTLCDDEKFKAEFEKRLKFTERYLQMQISKRIGFAVEDQAKLYAIAEIMDANFYDKLKEIEEEKLKKGGKNGKRTKSDTK